MTNTDYKWECSNIADFPRYNLELRITDAQSLRALFEELEKAVETLKATAKP